MKKDLWKKLLAGSLAAGLCLLSGCTGNPDSREDPLSGHNVDALLPFGTRAPDAAATATPTPEPGSTAINPVQQDWQNQPGPSNSPDVPTPTPTPTAAVTRTFERLEQGSEGDGVMQLQKRLAELGYLSGTADGKFGANTKTAVKLFQKALGLSQTGVATVSLQEKLFLNTAPTYAPSAAVTNPPAGQGGTSSSGYQALVRGDSGAEVQKLQNRLIELGYLSGGADGKFGAKTENAIKAFQAQLGLSQTGVASTSVQSRLYASDAPRASTSSGSASTPTAKPSGQTQGLEPGDTGDEVTRMQNRLKQLGYFTANATGNYYKETTEAIKRFQAQLGLSQTGIANASLLTQLYASNAPAYSGSAPAPTDNGGGYTTLQRGSKGTEVRNLQKRLIELGYMTTKADGDYGSRTENAVKLFQQAVGYTQNGVASVGLQNLLYSVNAPVYVSSATTAPTPVPTRVPASSAYEQLQPGDTGDRVKALQSRLKELGFFSGVIGGNYLTKTTDAVRLFQAAINHSQTGIATPEMQEVLYSSSAPTYSSVESEYVTLEKLDSGVQVLYLQQRLIELGYLSGSADGDFGSQTENAVRAFQKAANLEQSGKATAQTQQALFSSSAPYAPVATQVPTQVPVTPTQVPQPSGYNPLSYGSSGDQVKELQRRLKELGYFDGDIGGNYLTKTETAVKLFQAAIGYNQDGVASSDLQSLLFSASAPAYTGSGYIALSKGMTGSAVKNLQQRLIDLGYLSGSADGDFGGGTENAIRQFQAAIGYNQDGVASIDLQSILFSANAPVYQPQITPEPEPSGYRDLAYGDEGSDVTALQNRLRQLGYLSAEASGNYRGKTEEAIRLFQAAVGYSQTGTASKELQELLFSSSAPVYSAPSPTDAPVSSGYPTLSQGNTGDAVKAIQRRLKELGYFDGDIGGNYLTKTEAAVRLFQAAVGYPQDGVATPELQELLFSSSAPAYSAPSDPNQLTTLSQGDRGEAVRRLQQRLIELGWLSGSADGDFGGATANALYQFQYRMGLATDGVASIEAQECLFSSDAPAYVEYHDLQPGATGDEVRAIQNRLIQLGYLENNEANTDGIYGDSLVSALKNLQLASGTQPELADGIATIDLQTFLFSENALQYATIN